MSQSEHPFAPETAAGTDEEPAPTCQVAGCERPGAVPRKMRATEGGDPIAKHYVCRRHHRLFVAVRALVVLAVLVVFFLVFFQL
ncbi:hypothetical protein [Natronobiforma cellulositropha]|uniref:hypothetical protein n=1 Tax=Natronobiforma cellulositropha TaxID=1679076 RepID=UPI0021D5A875|nr:hypothetical protein [Natronobiforma cellulositropha]